MKLITVLSASIFVGSLGFGQAHEGMNHAAMATPKLVEKGTYVWTDKMDYDVRTGFGRLEPKVAMMILMMVGGSGFEAMKMAPMAMMFDAANFLEEGMPTTISSPLRVEAKLGKDAAVGENGVTVTIVGPNGKPVTKAKVVASVGMTNMDMGTAHPAVKELGGGKYFVSPKFTMMGPWRLSLTVTTPGFDRQVYTFDFGVK